jgi:hypothetical protein
MAAPAALDEGRRFPLCSAPALQALFDSAGLTQVITGAIEIETRSRLRRLLGAVSPLVTGPAPAFVASLEAAGARRSSVSGCGGACDLAQTEGSTFERARGACAGRRLKFE